MEIALNTSWKITVKINFAFKSESFNKQIVEVSGLGRLELNIETLKL